jgi:hypothetical protein
MKEIEQKPINEGGFVQINDTSMVDSLKEDINNFLWTRLHDHTTIKEAEEISYKIFGLIMDNQNKFI